MTNPYLTIKAERDRLAAELQLLKSKPNDAECNAANESFAFLTLARWEDEYSERKPWRSIDWMLFYHLRNHHSIWLEYQLRTRNIEPPRGPHSINDR